MFRINPSFSLKSQIVAKLEWVENMESGKVSKTSRAILGGGGMDY